MKIDKAQTEKELIEYIKGKGIIWYSRTQGEGRKRNNLYYCFKLNNGERRYCINPSEDFLNALRIE